MGFDNHKFWSDWSSEAVKVSGNQCCKIRLNASLRRLRFILKAIGAIGSFLGEGGEWHDQNSVSRRQSRLLALAD